MVLVALAAVLGLVAAQSTTATKFDPFDGKSSISYYTDVGLNLSIDSFFVGNASFPFTTKNVVWEFSSIEMIITTKDKLDTKTYYSNKELYVNNDSMLYTSANPCTSQAWMSVGHSPTSFVLGNWTDFLFVYSSYADRINYADFERPFLRISAKVYAADANDASCDESKGTFLAEKEFDVLLCWRQNDDCNVWFGDNGYLYLGGETEETAQYGFRLQPSWNITGPRVDMVIGNNEIFDVPEITSGANWPETFDKDNVPWMEFRSFYLQYGGWVMFHVSKNVLQRSIKCANLQIDKYTDTIMDLSDNFDTSAAVGGVLTFNISTVFEENYIATDEIDPYWIFMTAINEPVGWYVDEYDYQLVNQKTISFGMVLMKETPLGTTPTPDTKPLTTVATVAAPKCPKDCAGRGVCLSSRTCQCAPGWKTDAVEGCINEVERSQAAATTTRDLATASPVVTFTVLPKTMSTTKRPTETIPVNTLTKMTVAGPKIGDTTTVAVVTSGKTASASSNAVAALAVLAAVAVALL